MRHVLYNLTEAMAKKGVEAYVVRNPSNIKYVLGITLRGAPPYMAAIIIEDKVIGITNPLEENRAKDYGEVDEILVYSTSELGYWKYYEKLEEVIKEVLEKEKAKKCLSDRELKIEGIEVEKDKTIMELRMIKSKEEIRRIKEAIYVAEKAMDYAASMIEPGVSEREIASEVTAFILENSQGPSFDVIVASGPNAAYPHHEPGRRTLKSGEPVIVDLGAYFDGYASDMTRTFFVGERLSDTWSRIYNMVLNMQENAIREIKEGIKASRVDRASRELIAAEGEEISGRNYCHSLGHGVGIDVHEPPYLAPVKGEKDYTLKNGMVFTVEPGIYIKGLGGVRIEDMVLIEDKRPTLLTSFEKMI